MPKKHFWFKFEWDAWRDDPQLRRCSKTAKGFWIDCIALMEKEDTWFIEGTPDEICRDVVATLDEFKRSIAELKRTGAATILKSQGRVKIVSRRILKAANLTEYNRLMKAESRCQPSVKPKSKGISKDIEIKSVIDTSKEVSNNTVREIAPRQPTRADFGPPSTETNFYALDKSLGFPLADLGAVFPKLRLTILQRELITAEVTQTDRAAWQQTLKIYAGNHDPTRGAYMPERVGTLLNVFKKEKQRLESERNGKSYKSEREKSAERGANADRMAEQLREEALREMEALPLDDVESDSKVHQLSERSVSHRR